MNGKSTQGQERAELPTETRAILIPLHLPAPIELPAHETMSWGKMTTVDIEDSLSRMLARRPCHEMMDWFIVKGAEDGSLFVDSRRYLDHDDDNS